MKTITLENEKQKGWIALIAVNLMAFGTIAFLFTAVSGAVVFADAVHKRELRKQASLNLTACLDSLSLMAAKDYLLKGPVMMREFGCNAEVANDFRGNFEFAAAAVLDGVTERGSRKIYLPER